MNLNFIEDIEAISENFIDYEYIEEGMFNNPKSAYNKSIELFRRAAFNVAKYERDANDLVRDKKYKEAIAMFKKAIAETDKFIKEAEKLPDANIHDVGAAVNPFNSGAMTVQVLMNKGKIKNASKNYNLKVFNNWKRNYNKKIETLKTKI